MANLLNSTIPAFSAQSTAGEVTNETLSGHYTVLYFYPKDNTSGCTLEGRDFAANYEAFKALGCEIIGVSRDSLKSHGNVFGVMKLKKLYGREYMGIDRSTFLIAPDGKVVHEWRNVKVPGHVEAVLNTLREIVA